MYYIYHIRRPEHANNLDEGYIGVTGNLTSRIQQHKSKLIKGEHTNHKLQSYYDESKIIDFVLYKSCATKSEAYQLEGYLRPVANVGLNIAVGGDLTYENRFESKKYNVKTVSNFECFIDDLMGKSHDFLCNVPSCKATVKVDETEKNEKKVGVVNRNTFQAKGLNRDVNIGCSSIYPTKAEIESQRDSYLQILAESKKMTRKIKCKNHMNREYTPSLDADNSQSSNDFDGCLIMFVIISICLLYILWSVFH
ncbi:GIY-YIG nuclease family protein [Vibrio cortegadensis]|uniref:GIY-YIG nuclease family protein n=1 Tax=Vibrio cortegadensis TaxID=1328770 RepID=A0ABV4MBZ7_9VIBR